MALQIASSNPRGLKGVWGGHWCWSGKNDKDHTAGEKGCCVVLKKFNTKKGCFGTKGVVRDNRVGFRRI